MLRFRFCRSLVPIVLALAEITLAQPARAADRQKQVLVLHSTRRDAQAALVSDRELPRLLGERLPGGLDNYSEYID